VNRKILRRTFLAAVILAIVIAIVFALRPTPILVETGRVSHGPMRVTVDEDGETRAHDRFIVAAPVAGRLMRVELEEGDAVQANDIVASVEPLPLGQQQRAEVRGRIAAAESAEREAQARMRRARADDEQARRDLARANELARQGIVSAQAAEQARTAKEAAAEELRAAEFNVRRAAAELEVARSGLLGFLNGGTAPKRLILRSPVAGRILRVVEKSERVVQAGEPVVVIGDPAKIEIVADVLTTDAVNIRPGATVFLEGWGGERPLRARVRLVEPWGFTKISALGIEEKRVNVISDFVDSPGPLGDGYRVEARIVVWEAADVLKVPASATFRDRGEWAVYVVEGGRARLRRVETGHRNQDDAEILGGLTEGQEVILHPPNNLRDGMRVRHR
jgi:HlyD family secretion protein